MQTDRTTVRHHTANRFTNGRPKPGTDLEHLGKRKLKVKKIVNLSTIWEQSTCQTSPCSSWATVFKTVRPMLSDRRPVLSVCNVGVLWPNGWNFWIDQNKTLHGDRPRPRPHCVGWELISPKGHSPPPQFSAHVCCGQTVGWIKTPLGTEVGLGPGHIVLDGDPTAPKGAPHPNFRPMSVVAKLLDRSRCHLVQR